MKPQPLSEWGHLYSRLQLRMVVSYDILAHSGVLTLEIVAAWISRRYLFCFHTQIPRAFDCQEHGAHHLRLCAPASLWHPASGLILELGFARVISTWISKRSSLFVYFFLTLMTDCDCCRGVPLSNPLLVLLLVTDLAHRDAVDTFCAGITETTQEHGQSEDSDHGVVPRNQVLGPV